MAGAIGGRAVVVITQPMRGGSPGVFTFQVRRRDVMSPAERVQGRECTADETTGLVANSAFWCAGPNGRRLPPSALRRDAYIRKIDRTDQLNALDF